MKHGGSGSQPDYFQSICLVLILFTDQASTPDLNRKKWELKLANFGRTGPCKQQNTYYVSKQN